MPVLQRSREGRLMGGGDIEVFVRAGEVRIHFHRGPWLKDLQFAMDPARAREFARLLSSSAAKASSLEADKEGT